MANEICTAVSPLPPVGRDLEHSQRAALEARAKGDEAGREAARYYLQCGLHLRNVKAALPHGAFLPWCQENGISADQAQRWMREAGDPAKREVRQAKDRERKSRRGLRHLPTSNHPPEIDNDLVAAPEPDLSADPDEAALEASKQAAREIIQAFKTIGRAYPNLLADDFLLVQSKLLKSWQQRAEMLCTKAFTLEISPHQPAVASDQPCRSGFSLIAPVA